MPLQQQQLRKLLSRCHTGNNIGVNTPGLFNAVAATIFAQASAHRTAQLNQCSDAYLLPHFPDPASQPNRDQRRQRHIQRHRRRPIAAELPLAVQRRQSAQWRNISGATSNVLSIVAAAPNNSGSYQIIATNNYGSVTSSIALLTVGSAARVSAQPTNRTILSGGKRCFQRHCQRFHAAHLPMAQNGTNLVNAAAFPARPATASALASVTTNSSGNYNLFVTNNFGVSNSSVATLTVVLPPAIVASPANQTIECGSNVTFNVTASGTTPLNFSMEPRRDANFRRDKHQPLPDQCPPAKPHRDARRHQPLRQRHKQCRVDRPRHKKRRSAP